MTVGPPRSEDEGRQWLGLLRSEPLASGHWYNASKAKPSRVSAIECRMLDRPKLRGRTRRRPQRPPERLRKVRISRVLGVLTSQIPLFKMVIVGPLPWGSAGIIGVRTP